MVVGAEIVTGILIEIVDMTETVDMTGSVIEIQIVPVVMIQEVAKGHGLGLKNGPGIMIVTGILFTLVLLIIKCFQLLLAQALP